MDMNSNKNNNEEKSSNLSDGAYNRDDQEEGSINDQDSHSNKKKRVFKKRRQANDNFFGLGEPHIWTQNNRVRNKTKQRRQENLRLRLENDRLRADNQLYLQAAAKGLCTKCGVRPIFVGDSLPNVHRLRLENSKLTKEITRLSDMAAQLGGVNGTSLVSKMDEYTKMSQIGLRPRLNVFGTEASRETPVMTMLTNYQKNTVLKLSERMKSNYFTSVATLTDHRWSVLPCSAGEDIKVMTSKNLSDPGRPHGVILCAATSFSVKIRPMTIFDFLRDEKNRFSWDVLMRGGSVEKIAHIASGRDSRNFVSLLRGVNNSLSKMMILQESPTDSTGSYVIYAHVNAAAMDNALNGGHSDYVHILPSGFTILPGAEGEEESLITVSFQMTLDTDKLSVTAAARVEYLVRATVDKIKALSLP